MFDDNDLPDDYTPSCMVEKADPIRQLCYAIGIDDGQGGYGMTYGPTPNLKELLEMPGTNADYIFRFNPDGTDDKLYQWVVNKWVKQL